MLTIFSSPRPFKGEFDYIQRNAIQSWMASFPRCEIILLGDDEGTDKVALEFNLKHIPEVEKNEKGVLLRNSVFAKAKKAAKNEIICFVSADIILTSDFLKALKNKFDLPEFLISGRRWDLNIKKTIDFSSNWEGVLREQIIKEGKMHGFSAGDYFIFPKNIEIDMPPFSVKHGGWDNCFIFQFKKLKIPIIDATEVITTIHQNHGRPNFTKGKSVWKEEEGKRELKLAGGFKNMCTLREADWLLGPKGLKKPPFPRNLFSKIALFYPWRLALAFKRHLFS